MKQSVWNAEFDRLYGQEIQYAKRRERDPSPLPLQKQMAQWVPDGLQAMLEGAFSKAFALIFSKGSGAIEKTFSRKDHEDTYEINRLTAKLRGNKKSLRAFGKAASATGKANLLMTGAEGIGLGWFGIGLPDIPLFLGMLLRSLYEIALSFGFDYDSEEERFYLLRLIEAALTDSGCYAEKNAALDELAERIRTGEPMVFDMSAQIDATARALSKELLYAKFLQGIPLVGAVGGFSNLRTMAAVNRYAKLKYTRRFLIAMKPS